MHVVYGKKMQPRFTELSVHFSEIATTIVRQKYICVQIKNKYLWPECVELFDRYMIAK